MHNYSNLEKMKERLFSQLLFNANSPLIDNHTYDLKLNHESFLRITKKSYYPIKQQEIDALTSSLKKIPIINQFVNAYNISMKKSSIDYKMKVSFSMAVSVALIEFYNQNDLNKSMPTPAVPVAAMTNTSSLMDLTESKKISPQDQLSAILKDYQEIAERDPVKLRSAIPIKEIWRFFIDGDDQASGRGLKSNDIFQKQVSSNHFFAVDPLNYTIADYIKNIEKICLPYNLSSSPLWNYLESKNWNINGAEFSQLKLIDLLNIDKAWMPYESREAGYLKALVSAFQLIFDFSKPLTLDFINMLHKTAVKKVDKTIYSSNQLDQPGSFRSNYNNVHIGLCTQNTTEAGLYEFLSNDAQKKMASANNMRFISKKLSNNQYFVLIPSVIFSIMQKISTDHVYLDEELCKLFVDCVVYTENGLGPEFPLKDVSFLRNLLSIKDITTLATFLYQEISDKNVPLFYKSVQYDHVNEILNKQMKIYLNKYKKAISNASTELARLTAIIEFIQSCEQQHPYLDGNCRIFCMLLLNHLLIKNDFPLAILPDPNRFDMYGKEELLNEVLRGMQNTIELIRTGSLYNVKTDEVLTNLDSNKVLHPKLLYFNQIIAIEEAARNNKKRVGIRQ